MSTTYEETLDYLYNLEKFGISLGLHKIKFLLEQFGNPQDKLKVIHIAGSNGKGSTAAIIESILLNHNFSVGLYTSPHLINFNERIRVNQQEISNEEIIKYTKLLKPYEEKIKTKDPVTFFDFTTAMAFLYFFDKKVDYAILEVGLGGKLDSTNIINKSVVSIITNISKEHEEYLGNDLKSIAKEKAGIIKKNGIVVTAENNSDVIEVFKNISLQKNAKLYVLNDEVIISKYPKNIFSYKSKINFFPKLTTNLLGTHQVINASLAIFALEKAKFNLKYEKVKKSLIEIKWKGRLEKLTSNPDFLVDGAHNPAGAKVLAENLKLFRKNYNTIIMIASIMSDKNVEKFFKETLPYIDYLIVTKAAIERASDTKKLKNIAKKYIDKISEIPIISDAIEKSFELANKKDLIIFTGSLYAVGEAEENFISSNEKKFKVGNNYKR